MVLISLVTCEVQALLGKVGHKATAVAGEAKKLHYLVLGPEWQKIPHSHDLSCRGTNFASTHMMA